MTRQRFTNIGFSTLTMAVYFFLWLPVVVLILFSFNADKYSARWQHFTFKWYAQLFDNPLLLKALKVSLVVAISTCFSATIVGLLAAYGLYKLEFRGKTLLRSIVLLPIILPPLVVGIQMLVLFTRILHIPLGYISIIITHAVFSIPLTTFIILGRMQRIDWSCEEAALDLGATKRVAFQKVTFPLLMPAIGASALLVFPWSLNDFVITYFVSGLGTSTLPIYIYSQIVHNISPQINAIGTLMVGSIIGAVAIAALGRTLVQKVLR